VLYGRINGIAAKRANFCRGRAVKDGFQFSRRWTRSIGISLIALSVILYGAILLLPFLPTSGSAKLAAVPVLVILGEVAFWGGGAFLGAEVVARYRRWLNPRHWFPRDDPREKPDQ
jgi:hypothetical protein